MKRVCCATIAAVLLCLCGCGLYMSNNADIDPLPEQSYVYLSTFAYSFVGDIDTYVPSELQTQMDGFGRSQVILQAEPVTQMYTDIPKPDNSAKGVEPICIVLPELDLSQYSDPYIFQDEATGLSVSAYYRTVADVLTDELIKIYIDADGNIRQYETVNRGKYDTFPDAMQVESMRLALRGREKEYLADVIRECCAPVDFHAPSAYMLFTDTQGRIVLQTRGTLKTDGEMLQMVRYVDLYAIVKP